MGFDELDAKSHSTNFVARVRATVGSDSIRDFALPLAQACATLREEIARRERSGVLEAKAILAVKLRVCEANKVGRQSSRRGAVDRHGAWTRRVCKRHLTPEPRVRSRAARTAVA